MTSRFTRRSLFGGAAAGAAALTLPACSRFSGGGGGGGETTLLMSTSQSETAPIVQGLQSWADAVAEETEGALTIEIHASGSLGSDEDVIEQVLQGANIALVTDGGRISNYVPDVGIIGMAYITDTYDEVVAITESETFKGWDEELLGQNIKMLAYNWYDGPRNFYTNTPIETPEDLSGLRIRTPGSPAWAESVRSLGAEPIAMSWGETYNAMQSGAIDGVEAQTTSTYSSSTFEVAANMARTEHFHLAQFIMAGNGWFETLPEDLRTVLMDTCKAHGTENAQLVIDKSAEFEDLMVEEGLEINEPDKTPFIEASQAAYDELGFTELRDQLWSEIGK